MPNGHPMKFWGLLAMVAPAANITQQKFLIGSFSKIEFFHWSGQCPLYLGPYTISPYEIFTTHAPYTYTHVTCLTFFVEESSSAQYW